MMGVTLRGIARAQDPEPPDRARHRARHRDGQRHLRPDRHLPEGLQQHLHGVVRGTDAVVSGKKLLEFSSSGRAPVPESVLDEIRALPEVEAAAGGIFDIQNNSNPAQLVDADGKKIGGNGGAPTFGVGLDSSELRFSPLKLTTGDVGEGPDEVVIDANTASNEGYSVGDTDRRGRARARRAVRDHRYRDVRVGRLDRGRDVRRLRRADGSGPLPQGGALRLDLDRGQGRHDARAARAEARAARAGDRRGADGGSPGLCGREDDERRHRVHHVLPARVRRRRALRRRLRHLQHPVDHRRAAHARVRHAANARRLAAPGARARSSSRGS